MKKMLQITLMATALSLVITGCSMKSGGAWQEQTMSGSMESMVPADISKKQLHKAILSAGEKSGWKMTEFKSNSLVAEKMEGDESASATISYGEKALDIVKDSASSDSFYDSSIEELQGAITEELSAFSAQ